MPRSSLPFDTREPGPLEDADVLGDGGERHVESRREVADRAVAGCEAREDGAACRVGEGREGGIEAGRIVNHTV